MDRQGEKGKTQENGNRLFLFTKCGAETYLNFFRNLPVQIILVGFMVFTSRSLDVNSFDIYNFKKSIPYISFSIILPMAFLYNCYLFFVAYDEYYDPKNEGCFAIIKKSYLKSTMIFLEAALFYFMVPCALIFVIFFGSHSGLQLSQAYIK